MVKKYFCEFVLALALLFLTSQVSMRVSFWNFSVLATRFKMRHALKLCADGRDRTCDLGLMKALLYH
jgi:hypothetical protein